MKIIEFTDVNGMPLSVVPDKITAFSSRSLYRETKIYLVGDAEPFGVKGSYEEIKEIIEKC